MARINLFYLGKPRFGGWVTYSQHLSRSLTLQGHDVFLYQIGKTNEKRPRPFGGGLFYQNICTTSALLLPGAKFITAFDKNYLEPANILIAHGSAYACIHDPTEFKRGMMVPEDRVVTIRRTVQAHLPSSQYIPHPYVPFFSALPSGERPVLATTVCRLDFDKRTDLIIEANRLAHELNIPEIVIRGAETRAYTFRKLEPKYEEFKQDGKRPKDARMAFGKERGAAETILSQAKLAVDLSDIKGDGGGTQYSFLEAWDAGAVNVLNSAWIREDGVMRPGSNCFSVGSTAELVALLTAVHGGAVPYMGPIQAAGREALANHHYQVIAPQYEQLLGL